MFDKAGKNHDEFPGNLRVTQFIGGDLLDGVTQAFAEPGGLIDGVFAIRVQIRFVVPAPGHTALKADF